MHFNQWGGRSIAHGLLQLILWAGPRWADLANVLVTVLLIVLICNLAKVNEMVYGLMTFGMLFCFNANWSQTLLWQSGVANYLYMTTIILSFLSVYAHALNGVRDANKYF